MTLRPIKCGCRNIYSSNWWGTSNSIKAIHIICISAFLFHHSQQSLFFFSQSFTGTKNHLNMLSTLDTISLYLIQYVIKKLLKQLSIGDVASYRGFPPMSRSIQYAFKGLSTDVRLRSILQSLSRLHSSVSVTALFYVSSLHLNTEKSYIKTLKTLLWLAVYRL